jgi:integrase
MGRRLEGEERKKSELMKKLLLKRFLLWRQQVPGRRTGDVIDQLLRHVDALAVKHSTRKNALIALTTVLSNAHVLDRRDPRLKRAHAAIELLLLDEDPKKAQLLSLAQLRVLLHCQEPLMAVPLALMLPSGARFADIARIAKKDVTLVSKTLHLRIRQQKNIRKRLHQRWLSLAIPRPLLPNLILRLNACQPGEALVKISYPHFLARLKALTNDSRVTTYSIRRSVFEILRSRLRTIGSNDPILRRVT